VPPRLGAHVSIAGGVDLSIERALDSGCEALQVFTKNNNRWQGRPLRDDEIERFRDGVRARSLDPVVAHDSYLINVASPDVALRRKSIAALDDEMTRCERLGIRYLVMHPGSHVGSGEEQGIRRIAAALDEIHSEHGGSCTMILLENTAGQGTNIGWRFEHLAGIIARVAQPERLGLCIDTAHLFAAGFDIGTEKGWERTWADLDRIVGIDSVRALHVNDSLKPLGSRVDRHEHIGLGLIPARAFVLLMNDSRLDGLPAVLETPKSDGGFEDEQNLAVLRALAGRKRPPSRDRVEAIRRQAFERAHARAERAGARLGVDRPTRRRRARECGRDGRKRQ
jgi:deoxyribonuclease-4